MLQSWIDGTITFCIRYFRTVILAGLILAAASAVYAARHFAIDTDINDLISAKLPWRQHEIDFQRRFPQTVELIIADVHAPTPEAVKAAAREFQKALADKPGLFHSTIDQFDSPFFRRNGLLYLPPDRIEHFTEPLAKAKPLVAGLVTDPSLRGLLRSWPTFVVHATGLAVVRRLAAPIEHRCRNARGCGEGPAGRVLLAGLVARRS